MIFIKNEKDLKSNLSQIPDEIVKRIEDDLKIIEDEYPKYDEKFVKQYGPIVVLSDRCERTALKTKMPVLKKLETEYEEIAYKTNDIIIKKKLYILTESGILLYERYHKWGNE